MKRIENECGLTFAEWFAAANYCRSDKVPEEQAAKAWRAGEDPTEYAALPENFFTWTRTP